MVVPHERVPSAFSLVLNPIVAVVYVTAGTILETTGAMLSSVVKTHVEFPEIPANAFPD